MEEHTSYEIKYRSHKHNAWKTAGLLHSARDASREINRLESAYRSYPDFELECIRRSLFYTNRNPMPTVKGALQ